MWGIQPDSTWLSAFCNTGKDSGKKISVILALPDPQTRFQCVEWNKARWWPKPHQLPVLLSLVLFTDGAWGTGFCFPQEISGVQIKLLLCCCSDWFHLVLVSWQQDYRECGHSLCAEGEHCDPLWYWHFCMELFGMWRSPIPCFTMWDLLWCPLCRYHHVPWPFPQHGASGLPPLGQVSCWMCLWAVLCGSVFSLGTGTENLGKVVVLGWNPLPIAL